METPGRVHWEVSPPKPPDPTEVTTAKSSRFTEFLVGGGLPSSVADPRPPSSSAGPAARPILSTESRIFLEK